MTTHAEFLELAAAAFDFPLAPAERRRLDEHMAGCAACARAVTAMRRDAVRIAAIPVAPLSDRRQAALLQSALRQPSSNTMRLVAIAALLGLLLTGSLIVGAQLLRQSDDRLALVVPTESPTSRATDVVDGATPTPAASAPASAEPTQPSEAEAPATPAVEVTTPGPNTDSVPIPVDSIGVVVTNDLRVRSKPEVSDTSARLTPLLQDGQQVFILDGPVDGSGYRWYLVAPFGGPDTQAGPFGWVAAADKNGDPWLGAGSIDCPAMPSTFASFASLAPIWQPAAVALACFDGRSVSFPARMMRPEATCGAAIGWTIEPEWLGGTCTHPEFVVGDPSGSSGDFRDAVIAPGVDTSPFDPGFVPEEAIDVVLTGQWDHPAAKDCAIVVTEPDTTPEISAEEAVLTCRSQFVITGIADR
jgi:hypothetical protein